MLTAREAGAANSRHNEFRKAYTPQDVDNYASWMPQMKYYLIGKDLWDIVENGVNSDDDKKKDKKAIAAIGLRVKKHHLNTVEKAGTAKCLWETFQATYRAKQDRLEEAAEHFEEAAFRTDH